ncbi:MAG: nuclear transport factor 2 family protein [Flavobacteriales bacterium]|nr:nuclear transport factor 2 family protein [Flavobacteriales bacterium]
MSPIHHLLLVVLLGSAICTAAQNPGGAEELPRITSTLMDYIDGTANGVSCSGAPCLSSRLQPLHCERCRQPSIRSGAKYIDGIKVGEKNNRKGRIISIDVEHNAAMAKAEIAILGWRIFTDYFLLLKYEGDGRSQKSYTWREWPKADENK